MAALPKMRMEMHTRGGSLLGGRGSNGDLFRQERLTIGKVSMEHFKLIVAGEILKYFK